MTPAAPADAADPRGERLQRVLAAAGLGSRRACEVLIAEGRVEVDGELVTEQGRRVHPETAVIRVDGSRIPTKQGQVYLALNKPVGVLSAMSDDRGRPTVADLLGEPATRLFHIGRLDADTEGLLLLSNDGPLAHRLAHPSYGVVKTYVAEVSGPVPRGVGATLRKGVELDDGTARVDSFRVVSSAGARVMVELKLHEGRNRLVRRLLAAVGLPVLRLVRTDFGPITLGALKPGKTRRLSEVEVRQLYDAAGL